MHRRTAILGGVIVLVALVSTASASSVLELNLPEDPAPQPVSGGPSDDHGFLLPGDANGDGWVTDGDYAIWADNYGRTDATWSQGDFNGDGIVSNGDYTIWADNYGRGPLARPVPEPLTAFAALGAVGAVSAYLRRRTVR